MAQVGVGEAVGEVEPAGRARRRRSVRVLTALLAVVGLAVLPVQAADSATTDGIEGNVVVGYDGHIVPGRPVPVRITLNADRLVQGTVGVKLDSFGIAEYLDVDMVGGTSEEHWMLLEAPETQMGRPSASVRVAGDEVDLAVELGTFDADVLLLGTLEGLTASAPDEDAETLFGVQEIHAIPLEPGLLDLGPGALAALDAVAATPEDIERLPDAHVDALLGWLALGGTLYVDAPPGELAGWPEALQPLSNSVRSGAANVIATDGALGEGRWSEVVLPAPNRSVVEDEIAAASLPIHDVSSELFSADLGRDLPPLRNLLLVLAVYTLLVGPLAYLALRRKVMWRWLAIPALAGLATGAIYVGAEGPGAESTVNISSVIETGGGPAAASTWIVMATDTGGRSITAPAGWNARVDNTMGMPMEVSQVRSLDSTVIEVPALAGGVGMLSAEGPVAFDGELEIEAQAVEAGTVRGTVRNTTDLVLEEVGVVAGRNSGVNLGTLEPGASAEFEITGTDQFEFGVDPMSSVWPDGVVLRAEAEREAERQFESVADPMMGGGVEVICDPNGDCQEMPMPMVGNCIGMGCPSTSGGFATVASTLRDRGINVMAGGVITAIGWTSEAVPTVDFGSRVEVSSARTAVVSRAVADGVGDALLDAALVRQVVEVDDNGAGLLSMVYRFDLPADVAGRPVDPSRLRLDHPMHYRRVEILTPDGGHVVRDMDTGEGVDPTDPLRRTEVVVPPEAFVNGHVFVRVAQPIERPPPGRQIVVYEADA